MGRIIVCGFVLIGLISRAFTETELGQLKVVLLGSGDSQATPRLSCLAEDDSVKKACVCRETTQDRSSRNRRACPSLLVQKLSSYAKFTIVIDFSKSWRDSAERVMAQHNVRQIDAVLVSHGHADAIMGFDDLREFQRTDRSSPTGVYGGLETITRVKTVFNYGFSENPPHMFTLCLEAHELVPLKKIFIGEIGITPLPVYHGGIETMGFIIELGNHRVAYISDAKSVPPESLQVLVDCGRLDMLMIDTLQHDLHPTHMNLDEAMALIEILKPQEAVLMGLSHDWDYRRDNGTIESLGASKQLQVSLGFDGLTRIYDDTS